MYRKVSIHIFIVLVVLVDGGEKVLLLTLLTRHDGAKLKHFEEFYNTQISEMPGDWSKHLNSM